MVSWFVGVLQQLRIDGSVRCPHENEAIWSGRTIAGLRDVRKTGRLRHHVADGDDGGGKRTVQPACCWQTENPAGASAAFCSGRHVLAGVGIQGRGGSRCREPPLLLAEWSVYSFIWRCLHCDSFVKVRLTQTETDTQTDTQTEKETDTQTDTQRHTDTATHTDLKQHDLVAVCNARVPLSLVESVHQRKRRRRMDSAAVGRRRTQLERVLLSAQADTYLRALGSRVAERPAAEAPLLLAEWSVYSFMWRCSHCDSHVKVRLTETETETETETQTEVLGALPAACHPLRVAFVPLH